MAESDILPTEEECKEILSHQPKLTMQSFETLNSPDLSPLIKEIMSRQATMNIGTIGHVSHGKTTLVKAITGIQTTRHKIEIQRNITYNLGYANAKLDKCPKCKPPESYESTLLRYISFVNCKSWRLID